MKSGNVKVIFWTLIDRSVPSRRRNRTPGGILILDFCYQSSGPRLWPILEKRIWDNHI